LAKLFAYFNHKKAFSLIKKEVFENELYKSLFITKSEEKSVDKEKDVKVSSNKPTSLYDEDKEVCSIGNRKIQCGHVKSL